MGDVEECRAKDSLEAFMKNVKIAADEFLALDKGETIRLVSHLDCDGISAASIMIRMLNRLNRRYALSIIPQLDEKAISELSRENYKTFFFTDIGSGQIFRIRKFMKEKKVFILDHHDIERNSEESEKSDGIVHLNPHLSGIDGDSEISGAGVVFLFATEIDKKNEDMAHIALIGAIGDIQDRNGFSGINLSIIKTAEKNGRIKVEKGLRLFGAQTKPIHKLLEQSTDFFIPGITGSESSSIQFLKSLGINPRNSEGSWKKLPNLSSEEMKKLVTGIILMRLEEKNPEDILGQVYTILGEEEESPLRDAKEFSTLLNACGRMGKASFGIGACLGDSRAKQQALSTLVDYKKEIMKSLKWYEENRESKAVVSGDGFMIINASDKVIPTVIGTMASIISKSGMIPEGTIIVSMAQAESGKTKVSGRVAGRKQSEHDMSAVMRKITSIAGGEAGGHRNASGAVIQTENEEKFIAAAQSVLSNICKEEKVF
ncbi:MAG: DHH family phosphoesterase [Candidatus Woesearchaeota archaeon]|nr:DHH family phosphoesterase [Candidatus Woesearchaeota archaeon]